MRRTAMLALCLLTAACASPVDPEASGQWGSTQAGLMLSRSGGTLTLQCGSGTIDSTWSLATDGVFTAVGVSFAGGGPDPVGGRPARPSRFTGQITGNTFTLSVVVIAANAVLGPFRMQRNGPAISQVCL
jgi:hypothetical protein